MNENLYIQIKWDLGIYVLKMNKLIEGFRDFEESIVGSAIKNMGLFSKIPIDFKIETMDF